MTLCFLKPVRCILPLCAQFKPSKDWKHINHHIIALPVYETVIYDLILEIKKKNPTYALSDFGLLRVFSSKLD